MKRPSVAAGSVPWPFLVALVAGGIHTAFTFYWAAGGTVLVWSLGSDLTHMLRGHEWLLFPVGLVKLVAAAGPAVFAHAGWPARRLTRSLCWLGAASITVWGGANTVVANLVLADVVRPAGGFDRPGMIGHAWLWDPLFLVWGVAATVGLIATRKRRVARLSQEA